jgi:hypothetical protein
MLREKGRRFVVPLGDEARITRKANDIVEVKGKCLLLCCRFCFRYPHVDLKTSFFLFVVAVVVCHGTPERAIDQPLYSRCDSPCDLCIM